MADAQSLFSLMEVNLTCDSAWRVGKGEADKKPLVIKCRTAADRSTLMSMRSSLKRTKVYLDDDLTIMHHEHKRASMTTVMDAMNVGKWAIYRDGKVIIRDDEKDKDLKKDSEEEAL